MTPPSTYSPLVRDFMRPVLGIGPGTRLGLAIEALRTAPHHQLPIIVEGQLVGLLDDATVARALLATTTLAERDTVLQQSVDSVMRSVSSVVTPDLTIDELLERRDRLSCDVFPVVDRDGYFLGLIGSGDLVRELVRPLALPAIGGMATPSGVYLTTGAVSGGASQLALVGTGMLFFAVQLTLLLLLEWLGEALPKPNLPPRLIDSLDLFLSSAFTLGGFMGLIRLTPLAGYHAAEHQVVHALERSEPLIPEIVAQMPRVHPRCGTNFAAAISLFSLGVSIEPLIGSAAYVLSMLLTLAYWRVFGAWLQENLTTRPASPTQLAAGIASARELLARHERSPHAIVSPLMRLWRSGLPQILLGFFLGGLLLLGLGLLFPALGLALRPHLNDLF